METKDGAIAVAPAFPGHQEGNAKIYVYMIKMFKVFQVQACLYIFLDFEWFIVNVLILVIELFSFVFGRSYSGSHCGVSSLISTATSSFVFLSPISYHHFIFGHCLISCKG